MRVIKARTTKGPCRSCRYAVEGNTWDYEAKDQKCVTCTNKESIYYKSYLNMNIHGRFYPNAFCPGCNSYKKKAPATRKQAQRKHKTHSVYQLMEVCQ